MNVQDYITITPHHATFIVGGKSFDVLARPRRVT